MKNSEKPTDEGRPRLTTSISWRPEDLDLAKEAAKQRGLSLSAWIRQLILDSKEFQVLREHANSSLDDSQYEKAAKFMVVKALDFRSWSEVEESYSEAARQELLKQYVSRLRGQDVAKATEILQKAEAVERKEIGEALLRISPTPEGDEDLSVLDEKPSLDPFSVTKARKKKQDGGEGNRRTA